MKATKIKNTIKKINNLINENIKNNNKILFEASGNINQNNIKEYSKTGVDVISLGLLTHSVKAFDLSLEIK
jgi:nicotinate-nucleotide pyrophosphorylase (carboxylating)